MIFFADDAYGTAKHTARGIALHVLMRCDGMTLDGDGYSNLLVSNAIGRGSYSDSDRALMTRLVFGVIERKITLDYIISCLSSRPIEKLDGDVLNILRLGIYQLRYMDRVPEHAAVNETVELAKKSGRGFVNAILREYLRKKDTICFPSAGDDMVRYMSVRYSVSEELCREYINIYGSEKAEQIFAASMCEPDITLRVNTLRTTREELREKLAKEGFETENTPNSPYGIRLKNKHGMPDLSDGLAFVQDEASQICTCVLDPKPDMRMIDACACPGSKSFSSAMLMEDKGGILAYDIHPAKLSLIENGCKRLGLKSVIPLEKDSSEKVPVLYGKFDRVLCDVPCSGYGVLAKKPELRYKPFCESMRLPELQYRILEASAELLNEDGVLVYSTCTLRMAENEDNICRFLAEHDEFTLSPFSCCGIESDGMLTLTPDMGTDGFFIARIVRKKGTFVKMPDF